MRPTLEVFNEEHRKPGQAHWRQPRYYAVECEPGVFRCQALTPLLLGTEQVKALALTAGCELVLLRWAAGSG